MFKSAIALAAAAPLMAAPALAGPYVNVEANAGWVGDDYTGATTDIHVGYEGPLPVSDALGVYGEVSFLTADDDDDFGLGGKLGVKYNF